MVGAVTVVGQLLHEHVVEVAHTESDGGEADARIDLGPYLAEDGFGAGASHVAYTVGQQQHSGDATGLHFFGCHLVSEAQAVFHVGGAAGD